MLAANRRDVSADSRLYFAACGFSTLEQNVGFRYLEHGKRIRLFRRRMLCYMDLYWLLMMMKTRSG